MGLLPALPLCPIVSHLAAAAGFRFDYMEPFDRLRVILGGFSLEGWCWGWEGASVIKGVLGVMPDRGDVRIYGLGNGIGGGECRFLAEKAGREIRGKTNLWVLPEVEEGY